MILSAISAAISHIFNTAIRSATFPSQWKIAKVLPLSKVNSPVNLSDYRPISLLPVLSKAFEYTLRIQITEYVEENNFLLTFQSGFRTNHSTSTALLDVVSNIRHSLDNRKQVFLILLDYSKAFNSINFGILTQKLALEYNFGQSAVELLYSYLVNRHQFVYVDDECSNLNPLIDGVPQGSLLGPILFSLYVNEVSNVIQHCHYHLYADDLQIYIEGNIGDAASTIENINLDLNNISRWSAENCLKLNIDKTKLICIQKSRLNYNMLPPVILEGVAIPYSDTVKNLGLVFDRKLSWENQISQMCKTVYNILRVLWFATRFADANLRRKIFFAFVFPHFIYCDIVMFSLNQTNLRKLQLLFNACVRYVFKLRKYDHISSYSSQVLNIGLDNYFKLRVLCQLFRCIHTTEPYYIYDRLTFAQSQRTRNINVTLNPHTSTLVNSFFVRGVIDISDQLLTFTE